MADDTLQVQQIRTPYEVLFRWSDSGVFQGAQVAWLTRVLGPDGTVLSSQVSAAETVAVAGGDGFPLADIMNQTLTDALAQMDTLSAQNLTLTQQLETLTGTQP